MGELLDGNKREKEEKITFPEFRMLHEQRMEKIDKIDKKDMNNLTAFFINQPLLALKSGELKYDNYKEVLRAFERFHSNADTYWNDDTKAYLTIFEKVQEMKRNIIEKKELNTEEKIKEINNDLAEFFIASKGFIYLLDRRNSDGKKEVNELFFGKDTSKEIKSLNVKNINPGFYGNPTDYADKIETIAEKFDLSNEQTASLIANQLFSEVGFKNIDEEGPQGWGLYNIIRIGYIKETTERGLANLHAIDEKLSRLIKRFELTGLKVWSTAGYDDSMMKVAKEMYDRKLFTSAYEIINLGINIEVESPDSRYNRGLSTNLTYEEIKEEYFNKFKEKYGITEDELIEEILLAQESEDYWYNENLDSSIKYELYEPIDEVRFLHNALDEIPEEDRAETLKEVGGWTEDKKNGDTDFEMGHHYINPEIIERYINQPEELKEKDYEWIGTMAVAFPDIKGLFRKDIFEDVRFSDAYLEQGGDLDGLIG